MANEKDKLVQDLFKVVQAKKAEIAKAEKPNWLTNSSFGYSKDSSSRINLNVCADVEELISMLEFLITKKNSNEEAQKMLGTSITFKWLGFTFTDWATDIKTRIDKIQITKKKTELSNLETRLNGLVSKEMRDQMELEAITRELGL